MEHELNSCFTVRVYPPVSNTHGDWLPIPRLNKVDWTGNGEWGAIAKVVYAFYFAAATWLWVPSRGLMATWTGSLHADRYEVSISTRLSACVEYFGKTVCCSGLHKTENDDGQWKMKNRFIRIWTIGQGWRWTEGNAVVQIFLSLLTDQ